MLRRLATGHLGPLFLASAALIVVGLGGLGRVTAHADTPAPGGVLTGSSPAAGGIAGRDDTYELMVGGVARSYRLFVPSRLPATPLRLVVVLHYYSGTGAAMETLTGFDKGAAALGSLVAYPDAVQRAWNAGGCCGSAASPSGPDDVAFLDAVLDDIEGRYQVDRAKVSVGGWSNGGMLAYRYACERAVRVHDYFVGSGVPVAPSCPLEGRVAILHVHGLLDTTVPWSGTRTSPLTPTGVMPPVASALGGLAGRAGCTGWGHSLIANGNTRSRATGCPTGTSVDVITVPTMGHQWST
ncbi:MAG: alpha/beta hydrolase family esterase, partial [Oryzihumus sp.]